MEQRLERVVVELLATTQRAWSVKARPLGRCVSRWRLPDARRILLGLCSASEELVDRFFERRQGQLAEPRLELVEWLLRHRYTTHVRELERLLWIAISISPDDFIAATPEFLHEVRQNLELKVPEPDRAAIEQALGSARGNVTKAARLLGLRNRYVLYRLMKKVGLEAPAH